MLSPEQWLLQTGSSPALMSVLDGYAYAVAKPNVAGPTRDH